MSVPPVNTRNATIASILGQGASSAYSTASSATSYATSYASSYATSENGNYTLQVLFYVFLYAFLLFLILVLVHFTIRPVFKFTPGSAGLIRVTAPTDDKVYWNAKAQPPPADRVPKEGDSLDAYDFNNNFSFSVDLYVRKMTDTAPNKRIILYKTYKYEAGSAPAEPAGLSAGPTTEDVRETFMQSKCSMYMYLSDTNNLGLTFFAGPTGTAYSIKEIDNIPFYTPFRVTVVVEDKTFTMYINAKQTFQRIIPSTLSLNSLAGLATANQRFYAPPSWANSQTVFLQNFHIWPRAITYPEVQQAQPALARKEDFGPMAAESGPESCRR
jgi:NADH:ubiquinone oxidoreductase subunit 3 (subunit A)